MHASLLLLPISSVRSNAALDKMYQILSITISVRVQGQTDPSEPGEFLDTGQQKREEIKGKQIHIYGFSGPPFQTNLEFEGD